MPGGSKKGEHRGGAKPKAERKPFGFAPGGTGVPGRKPGTKNRPKPPAFDPEYQQILRRRATEGKERDLEMYFLVTGKRFRMPKEVMLDAMRYFEETAIDYGELVQANRDSSAAAQKAADRDKYEEAATQAEDRLRAYLTMAVDVAFKVAPYIHPRLSAIMTNPGSNDAPLNVLGVLLRDLDEAGRPPRYIDHEPAGEQ
jgi:hypothetical protein